MRFRSLILIAIALAAPTSSRAEPRTLRTEDPKLLAKQHVASAKTLHAQRKLPEALAELEAAYALDPRPAVLFAIGQLHVQLGECDVAIVFYRRFLASKPKPDEGAIAREAIETCKTAAPRAVASDATPRAVVAAPVVAPLPPIVSAPPVERPHRHRGSYVVAGGLLAGGVAASTGSLLLYRSSRSARTDAAIAGTYGEFADATTRANRRRIEAVVAGAAGVAALAGGVLAVIWTRRIGVAASSTSASLEYRGAF